jgi:single-stranded DNA-binding protein
MCAAGSDHALNHCLLECVVLEAPQLRYTQDNQTPVAEMGVQIDGLRPDDPPGQLKVVGWGNLAQDLQNRVRVGQRLVLEGRLRMNTVSRADGIKEKRAELTLARIHPLDAAATGTAAPTAEGPRQPSPIPAASAPLAAAPPQRQSQPSEPPAWNTSPLVPDLPEGEDDIPF